MERCSAGYFDTVHDRRQKAEQFQAVLKEEQGHSLTGKICYSLSP